MSFILLGLIILIIAGVLLKKSIKEHNAEMIVGMTALVLVAIILILFFGIFYRFFIF